jgi:hypothetical protein
MGDRLTGRRIHPVRHQRPRAQPSRVGSERAQVAQPREAVRRRVQQERTGRSAPTAWSQRPYTAAELQFTAQQPCPAARVTRPWVADGESRRIRHPPHAQIRQSSDDATRIAKPATRICASHHAGASPRSAVITAL